MKRIISFIIFVIALTSCMSIAPSQPVHCLSTQHPDTTWVPAPGPIQMLLPKVVCVDNT